MMEVSRLGLAWSGNVGDDVDASIDDNDVAVGIDDDDVGYFQLGWVSLSITRVDVDDATDTSRLARHR